MASNPKPVKNIAVVAIAMLLSFLVLQVIDLFFFPSVYSLRFGGDPRGVIDVVFSPYFQRITQIGQMGGYIDEYDIYSLVSLELSGTRLFIGIPLAAIGAAYILARWRDLPHLLDKDHARHMLLLGYGLFVATLIPFMGWYSFFKLSLVTRLPIEDSLILIYFTFMPQLVYISLSFVHVLAIHGAISSCGRGVI